MNRIELIRFINCVEERFPTHEWTIGGVRIWPLVRIWMSFSDLSDFHRGPSHNASKEESTRHQRNNLFDRATKQLRKTLGISRLLWSRWSKDHSLINDHRLQKKKPVVFLTFDHYRTRIGSSLYNRFTDPLVDALSQKDVETLVLELNHFEQKEEKYNAYRVIDLGQLTKEERPIRPSYYLLSSHLPSYDDFLGYVKAAGGSAGGLRKAQIKKRTRSLLQRKAIHRQVLAQTNAQVALLNCYYTLHGMALCLACRERGIPSIDVQHGVLEATHIAYGRWRHLPDEGYDLLPSDFWVWGDKQKEVIEEWSKFRGSPHSAQNVGNIWLRAWEENFKTGGPLPSTDSDFFEQPNFKEKKIRILVTLQPAPSLPQFMPPWVFEVINQAPEDWFWMIRLHPRQIDKRSEIAQTFRENCNVPNLEIDAPTDAPLPRVLRHTDVHITCFSSVVLEAEYFEVPSVLLSSDAKQMYQEQVETGMAVLAKDNEALLSSIRRQAQREVQPSLGQVKDPIKIIEEYLYASGS